MHLLPDTKEVDSIRSLVSCLPPFTLKSINHYNIENRIMGAKKWHSEYGCCPLHFLGRLLNSLTVLFLEPAPIANIFCITFKRPLKRKRASANRFCSIFPFICNVLRARDVRLFFFCVGQMKLRGHYTFLSTYVQEKPLAMRQYGIAVLPI